MNYQGVIIKESLTNKDILKDLQILNTRIEKVTPRHKTPWLKKWTLHTIEVSKDDMPKIAKRISKSLDISHGHWYADFKDANTHFIIFKDKIFKVDRYKQEQYDGMKKYGVSLGIPEYQLIFKAKKQNK